MFNLFKKKQQESEPTPKPEYVPEKPVVELFDAVKDVAYCNKVEDLENIPDNQSVRHSISFTFKGMDFTVCRYYHEDYNYAWTGLLNSPDYKWLSKKELWWLYKALSNHLDAKEQEQQQKKRQEFIDMLGG